MPHDNALCAALGHFIYTQALIYCPHEQAWTIVYTAGTDSDDRLYEGRTIRLGPFDGTEDALARARALTLACVQVRHRQFIAGLDRRHDTDGQADDEAF